MGKRLLWREDSRGGTADGEAGIPRGIPEALPVSSRTLSSQIKQLCCRLKAEGQSVEIHCPHNLSYQHL